MSNWGTRYTPDTLISYKSQTKANFPIKRIILMKHYRLIEECFLSLPKQHLDYSSNRAFFKIIFNKMFDIGDKKGLIYW